MSTFSRALTLVFIVATLGDAVILNFVLLPTTIVPSTLNCHRCPLSREWSACRGEKCSGVRIVSYRTGVGLVRQAAGLTAREPLRWWTRQTLLISCKNR